MTESTNKRSLGSEGERLAADYLVQNGYRLLDMNYRSGRMGEIDIVAAQDEFICFIEVKTRTGSSFGLPCEAVGRRKQENLRRLAWAYLKHRGLTDRNVRFDIVEVTGDKKGGEFINIKINLIRNAF
jgi:putative endonuclease